MGSPLVSYTGHIPNGHSAAIGNGAVFFGGGMSNGFEKVDPETLGSLGRVSLAPCSMSDDMPFVDGFIYVGCETVPYGLRVHADTLKADRFTLPGGSFGLFSFGGDLYNAAQDGYVDEFPKGDLKDLKRFKVVNDIAPFDTKGQDLEVNELLFSPVTKHLYLTAWLGIPGLYEVDLAIP